MTFADLARNWVLSHLLFVPPSLRQSLRGRVQLSLLIEQLGPHLPWSPLCLLDVARDAR